MGWTQDTTFRTKGDFAGEARAYLDDLIRAPEQRLDSAILFGPHCEWEYYAAVRTGGRVLGVVALVRRQGGIMYKDMDESMGPKATRCPPWILDMLDEAPNEWAETWRAACRADADRTVSRVFEQWYDRLLRLHRREPDYERRTRALLESAPFEAIARLNDPEPLERLRGLLVRRLIDNQALKRPARGFRESAPHTPLLMAVNNRLAELTRSSHGAADRRSMALSVSVVPRGAPGDHHHCQVQAGRSPLKERERPAPSGARHGARS